MPSVNDSILPLTVMYRTENRLSTISFKDQGILKIIKSLNVNKAHGHDDISIRLLQICGAGVVKPLSLIFKNCIQYGIFPVEKITHCSSSKEVGYAVHGKLPSSFASANMW